jgi:hypothetical protein
MAPDAIEEAVNVALYRAQTEAMERQIRWMTVLLNANVPPAEAQQIIADVGVQSEMEKAA